MKSCVDRKKYISFSKKMTLFTRGRNLSYLILVNRLQLEIIFYVRQDCLSEGGEGEGRSSSEEARASSAVTGFWWDGEWEVEIMLSFDYSFVSCNYWAAIKLIRSTNPHHS